MQKGLKAEEYQELYQLKYNPDQKLWREVVKLAVEDYLAFKVGARVRCHYHGKKCPVIRQEVEDFFFHPTEEESCFTSVAEAIDLKHAEAFSTAIYKVLEYGDVSTLIFLRKRNL